MTYLKDWFVSFLKELQAKNHANDLASIAITRAQLRDSVPEKYKYNDIATMMSLMGYRSINNKGEIIYKVERHDYKRFYNTLKNSDWDGRIAIQFYLKDPKPQTKMISWPQTKSCESKGYRAVSVIKCTGFTSGKAKKERVFVPLKDINNYVIYDD